MTHVGRARWLWSFSSVLAFAVRSAPAPVLGQCDPPPAPVADLSVSNATVNSLTLTWTAPGDDGRTGTAASYDIRYVLDDVVTINASNWGSAIQVVGEPAPAPAGTVQSMTVSGLVAGKPRSFAIRTLDSDGRLSDFSRTAVGTTYATQTLTIRPTGRGTYTAWGESFPNVGVDHWQNVDEVLGDNEATYLLDNSWNGSEIDSYVHPPSGIPPGSTIHDVEVCVRARQTNVNGVLENNGIRIFVRSAGTDVAPLATSQLRSTWTEYCHVWSDDPATGGPWTVDAVDALEIGARNAMSSSGPDGVQLSQAWMVVTYDGEPRLPAKIIRIVAIDPFLADGVTRLHEVCGNWKTADEVANEYVAGLNAGMGQPVYTYSMSYTADIPLASHLTTVPCSGQKKYTGFTAAHISGQDWVNTHSCGYDVNLELDLHHILDVYATDAERNADIFHEVAVIRPTRGMEFEGCMVCSPGDQYCYPAHDRILERAGLADAPPPGGKRYVLTGLWLVGFEDGPGVTEPWIHRSEAILSRAFSESTPAVCGPVGQWMVGRPEALETPWELITLLDRSFPGEGHLGQAHESVNSAGSGYNRASLNEVPAGALLWNGYPANFPLNLALDERRRATVTCTDWGCGPNESYGDNYSRWWMSRLPRSGVGKYDGRFTDWRRYLIDVNLQDGRGLPLTVAPTTGPTKGARDLRIEVRDTTIAGTCASDTTQPRQIVLSWTRERDSAGSYDVQQSAPGSGTWQTVASVGGGTESRQLAYPTADTYYRVLWRAPGGAAYASDTLGIIVNQGSSTKKVGNVSLALNQNTVVTARWNRGVNHCTNYGDMRYYLLQIAPPLGGVGSVDRSNTDETHYMLRADTGGQTKVYSVWAYDLQGGNPVFLSQSDHLVAIPNQSGVDGD